MPSPVVHSLAGLVLGRFARASDHETPSAGSSFPPRYRWRAADIFLAGALAFAANAADLDFIPGILIGDPGRYHHGPAHSLFAGAVLSLAMMPFGRLAGCRSTRRFGLLMGLIFTSHLLLDMLSTDNGIRNGVPLLWPLSGEALSFPFAVFSDIKRAPAAPGFVQSLLIRHNAYAMAWELVVITVVLAVTSFGRWAFALSGRR